MKILNRIARRLNPRLDDISLYHELTETEAKEFDWLDALTKDVESNMTLGGSTARTIARREAEFGIAPDESKPLSQRVSVLIAKLRGQQVTTPDYLKTVAASFEYGTIDVIDSPNKPYTVIIKFSDVLGVPPNLEDFRAALDLVRPAHIAYDWEFRYYFIEEVEAFTLEELETKLLENFAF